MTTVVDGSQLQFAHFLIETFNLIVDLPGSQERISTSNINIPELISTRVSHLFHPSQGTRSVNNDIILSGIDEHFNIEVGKDGLNSSHLTLHEIFIKSFSDIAALGVEFDIFVPFVHIIDLFRFEISVEQASRIRSIFGHVVNIDVG